jgi:hypothetical protein
MSTGRIGFGTELLIQFSPPPTPSAIGKVIPPPLIVVSALLLDQLKREKARSCTHQDALHPILLLVLGCHDGCTRDLRSIPREVQRLGSFKMINALAFTLQCLGRTAQPAFEYNAKMRCSTICL